MIAVSVDRNNKGILQDMFNNVCMYELGGGDMYKIKYLTITLYS